MRLALYSVIVVLIGALLLAGTAQAGKPQQHQIHKLRVKLALTQKELGQTQQQRDSLAAQLGQTQVQLANSQASLASTQQERDTYKSERDSYASQLNAIPTELQRAITLVRDEVAYTKLVSQREGKPVDEGYLISVAAMNYVVGHVTAGEYGFRHEIALLPLPSPFLATSAESALAMQAGICGTAAMTFRSIVIGLGLQVRSVQFYFPNEVDNHIADETFYNGAWHYFDPSWGLTFATGSDALSVADARSGMTFTKHLDQNLLWYLTAPSALTDELPLLTDPATRVDIGVAF
jgi:hypothetical protein